MFLSGVSRPDLPNSAGFFGGAIFDGSGCGVCGAASPTADGILGVGVFHAGCEACKAGIAVFIGLCKSKFFIGTGARAAAAVKILGGSKIYGDCHRNLDHYNWPR